MAWWLATKDDEAAPSPTPSPSVSPSVTPSPSPSVTPSPSASPSPTATATAAAFADVNGTWCPPDSGTDVSGCFEVSLPEVIYAGGVGYVYPPGVDASQDPSTWNFDVPANSGGCWIADVDSWPGQSGAAFDYCPAGAVPGDESMDRLWSSQGDPTDPAYVRADAD